MTESHPLSAIEDAASAWFLRRRERASDAGLEREFQRWLAQSPAHRHEYERLAQVWDDMAALPRPAATRADRGNDSSCDRSTDRSSDSGRARSADRSNDSSGDTRANCGNVPRSHPRPAWLRWGGAFAALVLLAGAAYQYLPLTYTSVANASTQTRSLELPDGTRVHANGGTQVRVWYTLAERRISIEGGEVYIDAAPDRRPLIVAAGDAELRDIGTEFNVLLLPELLQVGVRSGQVLLDAGSADDIARQTLHAGDTVMVSRANARVLRRQQVPLTEIGAWQDGVVVVHDVTLQQLAGYLALYREAPVRIADERARSLRLSGTLDLRRPEAFLDMLPALLPVALSRRPDGAALISSR